MVVFEPKKGYLKKLNRFFLFNTIKIFGNERQSPLTKQNKTKKKTQKQTRPRLVLSLQKGTYSDAYVHQVV